MVEQGLIQKIREHFIFFGPMSLLYGILFTFCMYDNPNGITFPFFVAGTIVFGIQYVKKVGLEIKKDTWIYAGAMMLLSLSSMLTTKFFFLAWNGIGIFLLFLMMMAHQFYADERWGLQMFLKSLMTMIGMTLGSIAYPFRHMIQFFVEKTSHRKKTYLSVLLGGLIAIALFMIILPLLVRSDQIFGMYFGRFLHKIHLGNIFWMVVTALVVSLLCYSFFVGLCRKELCESDKKMPGYSAVTAITFTSIIAMLYAIYCGIQVVCLFIKQAGMLPAGITYASYAREGFFELLAVSIINFLLVVICLQLFQEHRILKMLLSAISICTVIMIFSAVYRMMMYVNAYHFTFLRMLVLWFLGVLFLVMIGTMLRIYKKEFRLFRYIVLVVGSCYILFSFAKPDYLIAKYNVAHAEQMNRDDLGYLLQELSFDAAPVIATIDPEQVSEESYDYWLYEGTPKMMMAQYFTRIQTTYETMSLREWTFQKANIWKIAVKRL